jgi:hypothetical protein
MLTSLKYKKELYFYYGIFDREDLIEDYVGQFIATYWTEHSSYPPSDDFVKIKNIFDYFENKQKYKKQLRISSEYNFKILI